MSNRRSFLITSGMTAAMSRSAAGAGDRIRMGVIGTGVRGAYMATVLAGQPDCDVVAMCDVFKPALEKAAAALPAKADMVSDYRRVLERRDVDGVLIATPDHWHAPMIAEACQAGKDVYCEKPISNSIDAALKAVEAVRQTKRIVQIGLQQRSWDHFQLCSKMVQEGKFGTIYHAALHWEGTYTHRPQPPQDPPDGLDWEMFQGPAPRKPYTPARQQSWRSFYDYGGGIITDQGVHIADLVHWYLGATAPLSVAASAQSVRVPEPDVEQPPDTFAITWKYDKFVMSYSNVYMGSPEYDATHGVFFYGTAGSLHVNRSSYTLKPNPRRAPQGQPAPPPAFEALNNSFRYVGQPADRAHARNFLDAVKSRQKPLTDVETGFGSSLPLLLGVLACRTGRQYAWNGRAALAG